MSDKIIQAREELYGGFENVAKISQELKKVMAPALERADEPVREALEMICHKMARVAASEEGWKVIDNFADIAGYAALAQKHLENQSGAIKTIVATERIS